MDTRNIEIYDSEPEEEEEMKARKHSLIHNGVNNGKVICISFGIETGGDDCGILQLSKK